MLAILSPAKTLDFETRATTRKFTVPEYLDESKQLIETLRPLESVDLCALMGISEKLAEENVQRYADWSSDFSRRNAKQAVLAFKGDVYLGLCAETFNGHDLAWAQKHVRILSGLHGILRPLDLIKPYRLEMGTELENPLGRNLYAFWGDKVTRSLNDAIAAQKHPVLVNLASKEYYGVVDPTAVEARIITPAFRDFSGGSYKFLSFFAKKARGMMAAYMVKHRVKTLKALKAFDWGGYRYSEAESSGDDWVFLRDAADQPSDAGTGTRGG